MDADALRRAAAEHGLQLDDDAIDRLASGEEVEVEANGGDCCGEGWIGVGHHPKWCFKIANPPKVKVCWG